MNAMINAEDMWKARMNDMRKLSMVVLVGISTGHSLAEESGQGEKWVDLFNGKNLDGWQVNVGRDGDETSLGKEAIFRVKDGVIRVYEGAAAGSKQWNANMRHESEWEKFHLQVEYRWLEKKFEPRANDDRDAGILFHIHTKPDAVWPPSVEMQLGDGVPVKSPYVTGDLFVLGSTRVDSPTEKVVYDPKAPLLTKGSKIKQPIRTAVTEKPEKPHGEWNLAEVIVRGDGKAGYYLNGVLVNAVYNMKYKAEDGSWQPLRKGNISVQAEWAELEYKTIRVKKLDE